MSANLSPIGNGVTFFNAQGVILSGGKIYTCVAGSAGITQLQATYTDSTQSVQNANPIIIGANGMVPNEIWLTAGSNYKFVVTDSTGNILSAFDGIIGINDTSLSSSEWVATGITPTYISATSFSLTGDQTATYTVGRRVRAFVTAGTVYGTVKSVSFSTITTVVVTMDSTSLDNGLSAVNVGFLSSQNQSIPANLSVVQSVNNGPFSGFRNPIINGGFQIDQQNNGGTHTFTAGAALDYGAIDRWYGYCTGANVTGQRVAGSGNSLYKYQFTGASSVTGIGFGQRIAAVNSARFSGTTATLAIDLSNSLLTTVTWAAYYANSTDSFGTLSSPTRTQIATGTFTVTSTVTRYQTQITVPAAATTGIEVVLTVGAQTSGTFTIGNASLLPSSSNESYMEPIPYEIDLQRCMFYQKFIDVEYTGNVTNTVSYDVRSLSPMRATPSCISASDIYAPNSFPVASTTNFDASNSSKNSFRFGRTASATATGYFAASYLMRSEL